MKDIEIATGKLGGQLLGSFSEAVYISLPPVKVLGQTFKDIVVGVNLNSFKIAMFAPMPGWPAHPHASYEATNEGRMCLGENQAQMELCARTGNWRGLIAQAIAAASNYNPADAYFEYHDARCHQCNTPLLKEFAAATRKGGYFCETCSKRMDTIQFPTTGKRQ
jgi:hypothetical protein